MYGTQRMCFSHQDSKKSDKPTLFSEINKPTHPAVTLTSPGLKDEKRLKQLRVKKSNCPHQVRTVIATNKQTNKPKGLQQYFPLLYKEQFGS